MALALTTALSGGATRAHAQVPGPNVNMVSGTALPDGDPYLQRQNEPSGAVSTRNPMHLLAGANDYRTVDMPGIADDEEAKGDAWLGVFKSFDGGQTWHSTLIPGYPQDQSAIGKSSPLHTFAAGADPVVRAGTNGLFFYSGLAFNRGSNGLGVVFVSRFIDNNNDRAVYDKRTGKYLSNDPMPFIDTRVVDSGTAGQFIDKPYLAVDKPRSGGTCTIQAPGAAPQTIPASNVYLAYIVSVGNDKNPVTKMMLARSTDCGTTWDKPVKVSERVHVNQGATMAIDPITGALYLAWREIGDTNSPDSIIAAKSIDGGKTFTAATVVAPIKPFDQGGSNSTFRTRAFPSMAVDEFGRVYLVWAERGIGPVSPAPAGGITPPAGVPLGDARIVITTSRDGVTWTNRQPIDSDPMRPGHQIMPAINVTAGKVTVIYYDFRDDVSKLFEPYIYDGAIGTRSPAKKRHTMDVRVWQSDPGDPAPAGKLQTGASVKVSQYVTGFRPPTKDNPAGSHIKEQLQFNAPDLPLYAQGKIAFIGDYIDIAATGFVTDATGRTWDFNVRKGGPSAAYAIWTDNRDVRPPKDGDWTHYTPARPSSDIPIQFQDPTMPACVSGQTGMRNANIYLSRITPGLFVGAPTNSKRLNGGLKSFVVFVQNNTGSMKTFRLTAPAGVSFLQASPLGEVDVTVAPKSTVSRTVYVTAATGPITVAVVEVGLRPKGSSVKTDPINGGLTASVVLNPDVTNPDVTNSTVTNTEIFNPDVTNPDVTNPDVTNFVLTPDVTNPDVTNFNITNPDVTNPDVTNPDVTNPDVTNPDVTNVSLANPDVTNPDVTNPDVTNPDVTNPDVTNPDVTNAVIGDSSGTGSKIKDPSLTDVSWTVKNSGTTAGSFAVKPFLTKNAPQGFYKQLILHKTYATPITTNVGKAALDDCRVYTQVQNVLLANIVNPDVTNPDVTNPAATNPDVTNSVVNPDVTNATIWLEPGDSARITLRVLNPDKTTFPVVTKRVTESSGAKKTVEVSTQFEAAKSATPIVAALATNPPNADGTVTPSFELPLIIATLALPDGVATLPYVVPGPTPAVRLIADGGVSGALTWCVVTPTANAPADGTCPSSPFSPAPGLTLNPSTGVISGTPSVAGAFAFTVQVADSATPPHFNTQDLFIRVAPFAVTDSQTTNEDTPLTFAAADLLVNDPPRAANASTLSLVVTAVASTADTHGTVALANGQITYTPAANYNGPATFSYTSTLTTTFDAPFGTPPYPVLTSTAVVSITVVPVNDPPAATPQAVSTNEDTALPITLTGTDIETLSASLSIAITTPPSHGSLSAVAGHDVTYTPAANYNGADSFAFTVTDRGDPDNCGAVTAACTAALTSAPAVVSITIVPVNDPPAATPQAVSTNEDTALPITLTGTDIETLPANLSVAITTPPSHGSLSAVAGHDVTYTPAANYNGADSFAFTVTDRGDPDACGAVTAACAAALTSAPAVVSITVVPVNDPPSFTKGADRAVFDNAGAQTVIGWATAISAGPPDEAGQTLAFTVTADNPSLFSVQPAIDALTGTLTYTPKNPVASGSTVVTVTLKDNGGTANGGVDTSAPQTFTITVTHRGPTATDDTTQAFENRLVGIDVLANDSASAAAETLTVLSATQAGNGMALLCFPVIPSETIALWTGDGAASDVWGHHDGSLNGAVTFARGKVGQAFTFGSSGYVAVPDAPELTQASTWSAWLYRTADTPNAPIVTKFDRASNTGGYQLQLDSTGTSVLFQVFVNGAWQPAATAPVPVNAWTNVVATYDGAAPVSGGVAGHTRLFINGAFASERYFPSGPIASSTGELHIGGGDGGGSFAGLIDEVLIARVSLGPGDIRRLTAADVAGLCRPEPTGAATGDASGLWAGGVANTTTSGGQASTQNNAVALSLRTTATGLAGNLVFSHDATGAISGVLVSDVGGVQTYNISVSFAGTTTCQAPPALTGSFTIDTVGNALSGTVQGENEACVPESDTLSLTRETGSTGVIYVPNRNYVGTDSFTYTIGDGFGGTAGATVNVTVTAVNQSPTFTPGPQTVTVSEDAAAQSIPWATSITAGPPNESGQTVRFVLTQQFSGNSLGGPLFSTAPAIDPSGVLTFTPAPNANGSAGFSVQLKDDGGTANGGQDTSQPQFLKIVVRAVNDAPTANSQTRTTNEDQQLFLTLSATDVETTNPFAFAYNIVAPPQHGTLSGGPGPNRTYTPNRDYYGSDSFTFTATDSGDPNNCATFSQPPQQGCTAPLTSAPATVSITIAPVNDRPTFALQSNPNQTVFNNAGPQSVSGFVATMSAGPANETDGACGDPTVCSQTLNFILGNSNPSLFTAAGQPAISPIGTLTYTPDPNANGFASINVLAHDSGGTANGGQDTSNFSQFFSINTTNPLVITTTSLPPATTTQNYSASLNASNGNFPITWSTIPVVGALPPGLTLSGNQITGSPTRSGNFTFTVQATDSSSPTAQVATGLVSLAIAATDQQNFGDGSTNTLPIDSTHRVSQVVTAGASGPLTTLRFPTLSCSINPLTITIEGVSPITGMPDDANVLEAPWTATITFFNQAIPLPTPLSFTADQRFAIVLSSSAGACQVTNSSASDTYAGGGAFTSSSPWTSSAGIGDLQFQTQMQNADLTGMLTNHGQVRAVGISEGRVLVIGADGTAEVFDPSTRTSIATGPMMARRQDAAAVLLSNGNVLVTGGGSFPPCPPAPGACPPGVYLKSSEIYNPGTNQWSAGADMSSTRAFHVATVLTDNRVLVTGGSPSPNAGNFVPPTASTDVFTADGLSATPGPSMVQARQGHQATLLSTGQMLVTGGYSNGVFPFNSAEIVDAGLTAFVATGEMDQPRANHTATLLNDGTVLVAGGKRTTGPGVLASSYEIFTPAANPEAGTFAPAGAMLEPRFWHTATSIGGNVLFTGGLRGTDFINNNAPWAAAELWVPGTGPGSGAKGMPSMAVTRYHHGAVPIAGGLIAIAGGWSPSWQSGSSIELYDPSGPAITNPQLPDGSTSSTYPTTTLLGGGGTGPYTFAVVSGALPPGVSFDNGTFSDSGSKTPGTYLFVVQITDSTTPTHRVGFQTLRIRINPLDITIMGVPNGFVNYPYSTTLTATAGGGEPRKWKLVGGALPDGLTLSEDGLISGTPTTQSGSNGFIVQVSDGIGQTTNRSFGLPVNSASPPTAGNDSYSTPEDVPLFNAPSVLNNDFSYSGRPLSAQLVSGTTNGTLTLNANGSFSYSPNPNFNGSDAFTYTASDGVQQSAAATAFINISAVNDPPVAGSDNATTAEDTTLLLSVATLMANDNPGPNESDQTLTITAVQSTANTHGQISLNGGVVTFVPEADYNGPASFDYVLWDNGTSNGNPDPRSTIGHVFVTVTEVNDPPVAVDDSKTTPLNTPLSFPATDLTANDRPGPANESAQTLTVTGVTATGATNGTVTLTNGIVVYTPAPNYSGAASFTYAVCDNGTTNGAPDPICATGTVTVTVVAKAFEYNLGTFITRCDDCTVLESLPFPFPFFGGSYTSVFFNANGYLTFNGQNTGTASYLETVSGFASGLPRIATFWDDLISDSADGTASPGDAGLYYNNALPGRAVFTWYKEREYGDGGSTTVQAILFSDGRIQFAYNGVTSRDAIVGITPGGNAPLQQVNFSVTPFSIPPFTGMFEQFQVNHPNGTTDTPGSGQTDGTENSFNLDHGIFVFTPRPDGGTDVSDDPAPEVVAWGTVTGTATGTAGPLANQPVEVRTSADPRYVGTGTTDATGRFAVWGVPIGSITVIVTDGNTVDSHGSGLLTTDGETIDIVVVPVSSARKP